MRTVKRISLLLACALWLLAVGTTQAAADFPEEIPFVPTPPEVVDKMLELAGVKKGDVVYDLGSGDGRIVIRAAKKYGVKADISAATVVTLYMLPWFNEKLKPNFQKHLKPGARIVAHDFGIEGWKPDKTVILPQFELKPGGYKHQHTLYLWIMSGNRNERR
jgi:hypothetical protein